MFPGLKNHREKQTKKQTNKITHKNIEISRSRSAKKKNRTRNSEHLFHLNRNCKTVRKKEVCMDC